MLVKRNFKYRLMPSKKQVLSFAQSAGCCRYVFNYGLKERMDVWEKEGLSISYYDQNNSLTQLKKEESKQFLRDVHSQILQQSLRDLDLAFEHFFRRVKLQETPGFPKFKCKGEHDSFRYPQGVSVNGAKVYLPKIGWVRFRKSREIKGKISQTTVLREGNHWYVCFSCEFEVEEPCSLPINEDKAVGIDMGLSAYITKAQGKENIKEIIENPRPLKRLLGRIKTVSRALARKQKGSKNRLRCKQLLNKLHAKVRNYRHNFIHQLSRMIVKNHDIICVENLKVKKMLQGRTKNLSRSIFDAGWRLFLSAVKYKALEIGKRFVEIDEYYPSSQKCSSCSAKKALELSEREYSCENCGLKIDRDFNAAINIKAAGMSVLKACGAT